MNKFEELKPCPFCGQYMKKEIWGHSHPHDENKPCPMNGLGWTEDSKNFKAWNTRAPDPLHTLAQEMAEALRYISCDYSVCSDSYEESMSCVSEALTNWNKFKEQE